jgi:predicted alpha/beta-fold hydrolase
MPVLPKPAYPTSFWLRNGHLQTIYPSLFRKVKFNYQQRERLELTDGDFVDLDWYRVNSNNKKLIIITHGLEGDSGRHYVKGMAKMFTQHGYDALGWNCRSCSGEINRLPRFYHHGDTGDLRQVLYYAIEKHQYEQVVLAGFSMGGSLTLRILGENPAAVPHQVKKAIAYSVPCDLLSSVKKLSLDENKIYNKRFLRKLGEKIAIKEKLFPSVISAKGYSNIKHFVDFDNRYTAPLHGFKDAQDFYIQASVKPFLKNIAVPSLMVQAINDSFLSPECFCYEEAAANENLFLEVPDNGGHCGFMLPGQEYSWAEQRALDFVQNG